MHSGGSQKLEFRYDYLGRRIEKKVFTTAGTTTTLTQHVKYVYDGWNLIADVNGAAPDTVLRTFTWGLDASETLGGAGGVGGLLRMEEGGVGYHAVYDPSHNVTGLVRESAGQATLVASYAYGPFGEKLAADTALGGFVDRNPFRYSTKYTDAETGLVYYGHRYYEPRTGRFLGRDPLGEAGGSNLYGFVRNNPVNRSDFLGMYDWYYEGPDGQMYSTMPHITDSPGDFLAMDRETALRSASRTERTHAIADQMANVERIQAANLNAILSSTASGAAVALRALVLSNDLRTIGQFDPVAHATNSLASDGKPRANELSKSVNVGTIYDRNDSTNALKFDGSSGTVLVVYSGKELGYLGGNTILESIGSSGSKFVSVFDVDKGSKDLGSFRFNNIVLVRHGGIDGSGDSKMIKAFSPGSPLISMLSPLMTNGGSLWLNQCFAGSFVAKTPGYLTAISQSFGGANVYYGTGMQATFNFGLASRVATGADSYIANRYLNYQVYKPGP